MTESVRVFFILGINIVSTVAAQILLKLGMRNSGGFALDSVGRDPLSLIRILLNPFVFVGMLLYVINVFLWPTEGGPTGGRPATTRQGYHLLHWTTPAYSYWVASDLGLPELRDFAALLQRGDSVGAAPAADRVP